MSRSSEEFDKQRIADFLKDLAPVNKPHTAQQEMWKKIKEQDKNDSLGETEEVHPTNK